MYICGCTHVIWHSHLKHTGYQLCVYNLWVAYYSYWKCHGFEKTEQRLCLEAGSSICSHYTSCGPCLGPSCSWAPWCKSVLPSVWPPFLGLPRHMWTCEQLRTCSWTAVVCLSCRLGGALPSRAHLLLSPTKLCAALVLDGRAASAFGTQTFAISGISQPNLLGGSSWSPFCVGLHVETWLSSHVYFQAALRLSSSFSGNEAFFAFNLSYLKNKELQVKLREPWWCMLLLLRLAGDFSAGCKSCSFSLRNHFTWNQ